MVKILSWEDVSLSAIQEIFPPFVDRRRSLSCSQEHTSGSYLEPDGFGPYLTTCFFKIVLIFISAPTTGSPKRNITMF